MNESNRTRINTNQSSVTNPRANRPSNQAQSSNNFSRPQFGLEYQEFSPRETNPFYNRKMKCFLLKKVQLKRFFFLSNNFVFNLINCSLKFRSFFKDIRDKSIQYKPNYLLTNTSLGTYSFRMNWFNLNTFAIVTLGSKVELPNHLTHSTLHSNDFCKYLGFDSFHLCLFHDFDTFRSYSFS